MLWNEHGGEELPPEPEGAVRPDCSLLTPRLGDLLCVHGRLAVYNGQLQLNVTSVTRVVDSNAELLHWADAIAAWTRRQPP